jgi:hypothetical protein
MNIISLAFDLARLKGHAMADYRYPFWHAAILLTVVGLSAGLDHTMGVPMPWSFAAGLVLWWVWLAWLHPFMRWWLKRGGRWDGAGPLFNVLVAACGIDILWGVLIYLGVPPLLLLPLLVYSFWVMGNALEHATGVRLGYAIAGAVLALLAFIVVAALVGGLLLAGLDATGLMPMVKP